MPRGANVHRRHRHDANVSTAETAPISNPDRSGYLSILLHAHLPFIRHPEYEDSLEERWLDEALIESYLPLLRMLEGRAERRAPGRITISLSPTLLAMLEDPLLRRRFAKRLEQLTAQRLDTVAQLKFRRPCERMDHVGLTHPNALAVDQIERARGEE